VQRGPCHKQSRHAREPVRAPPHGARISPGFPPSQPRATPTPTPSITRAQTHVIADHRRRTPLPRCTTSHRSRTPLINDRSTQTRTQATYHVYAPRHTSTSSVVCKLRRTSQLMLSCRVVPGVHFVPYIGWGAAHQRSLRLEVRRRQRTLPMAPPLHQHHTPASVLLRSECGDTPSALWCLSEGVMGRRACPLAPPGCPTRWGATSCNRSKAAPLTDRMRRR
jgi:hypothetical protein